MQSRIPLTDNVLPLGLYLAISAIRSRRFDIHFFLYDVYGFVAITEIAAKHGDVAVTARLL